MTYTDPRPGHVLITGLGVSRLEHGPNCPADHDCPYVAPFHKVVFNIEPVRRLPVTGILWGCLTATPLPDFSHGLATI